EAGPERKSTDLTRGHDFTGLGSSSKITSGQQMQPLGYASPHHARLSKPRPNVRSLTYVIRLVHRHEIDYARELAIGARRTWARSRRIQQFFRCALHPGV